MPYINYDKDGNITEQFACQQYDEQSYLDDNSPEFQTYLENKAKKLNLQLQINNLDLKSIRALREDGIKDEASGQTWLEYYTSQIQDLRSQIAEL